MEHVWSAQSISAFYKASQRSRYLASDGLINAPNGDASLYNILHVPRSDYSVYKTEPSSLVVLSAPSCFYLTKSSDLERHVGLRRGTDAGGLPKLNTLRAIWSSTKDDDDSLANALASSAIPDVKTLYDAIVMACRCSTLTATMTAQQLRAMIPRASRSEGIDLGSPL